MHIKLKTNKSKEIAISKKPVTNDSASYVSDTKSLTFTEFLLIFENNFYPSLVADILFYIAGIIIPQKVQEQAKKIIPKEDVENSETRKEDMEMRSKAENILESSTLLNKIFPIFQKLAENPQKGESRMYITLYSLSKGFVSDFSKHRKVYLDT
jgi:hypothetical protein